MKDAAILILIRKLEEQHCADYPLQWIIDELEEIREMA